MPLIDDSSPANDQTSREYWEDELKNSRILLYEINKAIQVLSSGNHQSYTLDTGQSRQTVTRLDLNSLFLQRDNLINQISNLENKLGYSKSVKQVIPLW